RVDLECRALGQGRDLDGRTRRVRLAEVFGHHRVDLGELAQVGQVQPDARDVVERPTGRLAHGPEVVERAPGLHGDAAGDQLAGARVDRDLAGHVDRVAAAHGLRVGADGGGGFVGVDGLAHGWWIRDWWLVIGDW